MNEVNSSSSSSSQPSELRLSYNHRQPVGPGDERHCIFDCPRFCELRQEHADLFGDARAMRSLMWHKDPKSVCALILAIVMILMLH